MRKQIILVLGLLTVMSMIYSQKVTITENFDGNYGTFTSYPASAWKTDTNYHVSYPNSFRGKVPHNMQDSIILETSVYDFESYGFITLRFNHICKVSPRDTVRLEYRINDAGTLMGAWRSIPQDAYLGSSTNYTTSANFSAASYAVWQANDSTAYPTQLWWRSEAFDLSYYLRYYKVQFRFLIKRGNVPNTQISYGWLIDDFELIASTNPADLPVVEFLPVFPQDTVYSTGPYTINAKVATRTTLSIKQPYLKYTAIRNGIHVETDSILMQNLSGDSIWSATIKQFLLETEVSYSIIGEDLYGNYSTAMAMYLITKPQAGVTTDSVIIGNEASTLSTYYYPYTYTWDRGWTRSIYLDHEINLQRGGGMINSVYYDNTSTGQSIVDSLFMYFKAVTDNTITVNGYVDPIADGATLVWGEATSNISGAGWKEFRLHSPFYLPPSTNLMIYWNNQDGSYANNGAATFRYTDGPTNISIQSYADDESFPTTQNVSLTTIRANLKLDMGAIPDVNNSAAMYSIDIPDSVMTSPTHQTPIVVTIKNRGTMDLSSATISYSLNGSAPVNHNWTASTPLPWDYIVQDTLGFYTPKLEGYDTLEAWIKLPNGQTDSFSPDDLSRKIIYGTTDIHMKFTKIPGDTVYATGPHQIEVNIESLTGIPVNSVSLNIAATYDGSTTNDTLLMTYNATDNTWGIDIPSYQVRTNVEYNITLRDILGNEVTISKSYYIKRVMLLDGIVGAFYFSPLDTAMNSMSGNNTTFIQTAQPTSWSRSLYPHEDLANDDTVNSRIIGSYGIRAMSGNTPYTTPHLKIYFKAVTETIIALGYIDPVADGATLVYEGDMYIKSAWVNGAGAPNQWSYVIFQTPFILPPKHNILVYVEDYSGTTFGAISWASASAPSRQNVVYGTPIGTGGTARIGLLSAIFGLGKIMEVDSNSVALKSIISPLQKDIQFTSDIDVVVSLLNIGIGDLDSCYIDWTLNGVLKPRYVYSKTPSLLEGFYDTIKIGSFTTIEGRTDQIVVWTSMPNGKIDKITYDDTLSTMLAGCQNPLQGTYLVGANAPYYKTLNSALYAIEQCGMSGKVTLELESQTFEESVMFNFNMTTADTLEIYSRSGTVNDVIINPIRGSAFILKGAIHNLTLKGFTIDSRRSGSHGIEITGACTNVVIHDCEIYANPASTAATACAIYCPSGGRLDNISIKNNLINGGYAGVYLYGTSSSIFNMGVTLENNIIQDHYYYGLYGYYTEFSNIAYNTILSSASSIATESSTTWYGMYLYYANGPVIENKIQQRGTRIISPYGMYLYNYHYYPTRTYGLVANNEIIIRTTSTYSGIYMSGYVRGDFLHNSIYVKGASGASRGIYIANSAYNLLSIRNNNIVMESSASHPIYLSLDYINTMQFAYNNIYSPNYVAFIGAANIPNLQMWKLLISDDSTSISVKPSFIDVDQSLELTSYSDLLCIRDPLIQNNIKGESRNLRTTIGAYGMGLPDQYDIGLSTFIEPTSNRTCSPDNVPVQVTMINNGSVVHDFTTDPVTLHLNVKSLSGTILPYDTVISIVSGKLDLFKSKEYIFSNMVDVSVSDDYYITVWITNQLDSLPLNDTIRKIYSTVKILLPVDENFSNGIPAEFYVSGNTSSEWTPVTEGIGADSVVKPVFGTSMLMFTGSRGATTELTTGKLELQRMVSPILEFWYFHDTVYGEDYLDVNVILDEATSITVLSLLKQDTTYGWKSYEVDLTTYISNGSCVNITFEAMSVSGINVSQYIDRIRLTAQQDIAVTEVLTEYSACDLKNKEWKIILSNLTYLALNYNMNPTDVILEIEGIPYIQSLNSGFLSGFASDTITMTSGFDFLPGTYQIKAYFTAKLDEKPLNDTLKTTIDVNPSLSVLIHPESGETAN
jgi:hypothetical protein